MIGELKNATQSQEITSKIKYLLTSPIMKAWVRFSELFSSFDLTKSFVLRPTEIFILCCFLNKIHGHFTVINGIFSVFCAILARNFCVRGFVSRYLPMKFDQNTTTKEHRKGILNRKKNLKDPENLKQMYISCST